MPNAYIDFAFLPLAKDRQILDLSGISWFFGRASNREPIDFDLVMISNSCALELVNIAYLFSTSRIPVLSGQRETVEDMPIFIIGGSNSSALGALLSESDSIIDGIFFGEGEGSIGILASLLCSNNPSHTRLNPDARKARLIEASREIAGFWPCDMPRNAKRHMAEGRPHTLLNPLVLNGDRASTVKLAITAGCMGFCSFCLEGWDRSPYSEADFSSILEKAHELRRRSGAAELEISSYNFNTHSRIFDLIYDLNKIFRRVSFMSQRLDILAETGNLMDTELASGKRSFTLGIEGISNAMRSYYRKGLSPEHLKTCVEISLRKEVREIKLFYIISGLETERDTDEFEAYIQSIQNLRKERALGTRIIVSAGYLVRLPYTPLQYSALTFDKELLEHIAKTMEASCKAAGLEFRLAGSVEECFVDQTLSLFGEAAHEWLLSVPARGILYDATLPASAWKGLEQIIMAHPRIDWLLAEKSRDFRPPLGFIESDARYHALWHNFLEAKAFRDRASCFGHDCTACEACESKEEIVGMTGHRTKKLMSATDIEKVHSLVLAKARFEPVYCTINLPEQLCLANESYRDAWLSREFSRMQEQSHFFIFEAKELAFFSDSGYGRYGLSCFALYGPSVDHVKKLIRSLTSGNDQGSLRGISIVDSKPRPSIVHASIVGDLTGEEAAAKLRMRVETFLRDNRIDCTASRVDRGWKFDIAQSSRGRKTILSAGIEAGRSMLTLNLGLGLNAEPSRLLEEIRHCKGMSRNLNILSWEP
jgi:hypothetical protein